MYKKYNLGFPFLVSYYEDLIGFYTGPLTMSGYKHRSSPVLVERFRQMLAWMDALDRSWEENGYKEMIREEYPYVASYSQVAKMSLVQELCISLCIFDRFRCNHPLLLRMHQQYKDAMSDDPERSSFLNLQKTDPKQAKLAYQLSLYYPTGQAGRYLLEHVCGKTIPTERYLLVDKSDAYRRFDDDWMVEHTFTKAFKQFIKEEEK